MKTLDISTVPVENVTLVWVIKVAEANKVDKIFISQDQRNTIFSGGGMLFEGKKTAPWGFLRMWRLVVKDEN
jgi:hypothetical protein